MISMKTYWVWLAKALGADVKTDEIFSAYKSPDDIYEASRADRMMSGIFTKAQSNKLSAYTLEEAEAFISYCENNGWHIVTPADKEYPAGLRKIRNFPLALYVDGDINCLRGKVMIGVVGTRNPGAEGVSVAHNITTDLAAAGAVIVSGGAIGIDSAAHEGALYAGGKTICVLGCGFGTGYLKENKELRKKISKNGALVSEYPPYTHASKISFPKRNRIISGMSHAVLVVEAGEKSGSLITAKKAFDQNRDVFAVPGNILSSSYSGANKLLNEGAKAASDAHDILRDLAVRYPDRLNLDLIGTIKYPDPSDKKETDEGLDPDMESVYNCLSASPLHFDDIVAATGLSQQKAVIAIMNLELADYIEETESKKYILK